MIPLLALALAATPIEVQGHRGARAVLPENTLPAFEYALSIGVDTLELDLGVTKDGHVIVFHDPYVAPDRCRRGGKRLTRKIPFRTLTLEEVKRFDCGSLPHQRFEKQKRVPGAKIPTLAEVFELVAKSKHQVAKRVEFNIETKSFPAHPELTPSPEVFAKKVVAVVRKHGMTSRTIVQSFDYRTLVATKKLEPKIRIAMLQPDGLVPLVAVAKALGAEIVSPHHEWITKAEVAALRKAGVRVIPWTANDEKAWARLVDLGVDGIITDDPAALIAFLEKKKLR